MLHVNRKLFCALLLSYFFLAAASAQRAPSSLPTVAPQARKSFVAVLVWHDVLPKKEVWFDTTLATFRQQLETLRRRKFNVLTLDALRQHLTQGTPIPPRSLVLTFDDNTRGLYDHAFPLLKKYNFPATLFVHTDYVGVRTVKDHCTWTQLAEMQKSGLVTIQSLTCSHPPDLRRIPVKQLDHELRDSRTAITKRLGTPVYAFVYTEGKHDSRLAQAVHRNGYTLAFTEDGGNACASSNLLQIHRYSILKRFAQALDEVDRAYRR
jgi:poly-beta-1,6-N-acetyl-D-glucosamine N-deacetylase